MTKTRTGSLLVAGIGIVAVWSAGCTKFHYVDPKPAFAVGEEYFSNLKQNRLDEAFDLYTQKFLQKERHDWQQTITGLNAKAGGVTSFEPRGSLLAPVTLDDGTLIPCVVVRYRVARGQVISDERLTICSHQRGEQWGIAGHRIARADTGEHFEAGLTILEKEIISTK